MMISTDIGIDENDQDNEQHHTSGLVVSVSGNVSVCTSEQEQSHSLYLHQESQSVSSSEEDNTDSGSAVMINNPLEETLENCSMAVQVPKHKNIPSISGSVSTSSTTSYRDVNRDGISDAIGTNNTNNRVLPVTLSGNNTTMGQISNVVIAPTNLLPTFDALSITADNGLVSSNNTSSNVVSSSTNTIMRTSSNTTDTSKKTKIVTKLASLDDTEDDEDDDGWS